MSRISSQETFMGLVWQKAYRKHCLLPLQMVVSYTCILFIQCCDLHNTYVLQWHMSFWYLLMVYSKNQWCTLHLGPIWSVKPSNFHSRSHRYSQNRYDPPKSFPARYESKTVKSLRHWPLTVGPCYGTLKRTGQYIYSVRILWFMVNIT